MSRTATSKPPLAIDVAVTLTAIVHPEPEAGGSLRLHPRTSRVPHPRRDS